MEVLREQGVLEVLKRTFRRIVSSLKLGPSIVLANLKIFSSLSDKRLMNQVKSQWNEIHEFITYLRTKDTYAFPFSNEAKDDFLIVLRKYFPHEVEQTIQDAERICRHEFHVLGQDFLFPERINWHLDPVSGESWPKQHIGMIERWFYTEKRSNDPLPVWGLNRHYHFTTLGKAYVITGNEKYAVECASQLNHWVEHNSCAIGINWFDSLEVSIRLVSWVIAFHLLKTSDAFISLAGRNFIKRLYQQTHFVKKHLSINWQVPNNHLIGEVTAMVLIGALFPEFKDSEEWTKKGLDILEKELESQTFEDGVNKEQSPAFHRFVLDFTLLVMNLSQWKTIGESSIIEHYTEKMLEYIMYATAPDSKIPMIGDASEIRGYKLSGEGKSWDFREKLAIGAVLYKRGDFKCVANQFGEEAFWLLGGRGLEMFEELSPEAPDKTSVSFPQGGHYIIRDSWEKSGDFCFFRCGNFGLGGEGFCGHSHCDLLSFVLWVEGKEVIVDSGSYTFHDSQWRDYFRLTSAHNTLILDGKDQAIPIKSFGWKQVPNAICEFWGKDKVRGMLAIDGIVMRREIYHPAPGLWHIRDMLSGQGEHAIDWFFHFSPRVQLKNESQQSIKVFEDPWSITIKCSNRNILLSIEDGWVSQNYGLKQRNKILHGRWRGNLSEGLSSAWEIVRS